MIEMAKETEEGYIENDITTINSVLHKRFQEWAGVFMDMSVTGELTRQRYGISDAMEHMKRWCRAHGVTVVGERFGCVIVVSDQPDDSFMEAFHKERCRIGSYFRIGVPHKATCLCALCINAEEFNERYRKPHAR